MHPVAQESFGHQAIQLEPVGRNRPPTFMPYEAFCAALHRLPPGRSLEMRGPGDPLTHPRLFDMVAYATELGIPVCVTTRLVQFSERRAQECVASGLRLLRILRDAPDATLVRKLARLKDAQRVAGAAFPEIQVVTAPASPSALQMEGFENFANARHPGHAPLLGSRVSL